MPLPDPQSGTSGNGAGRLAPSPTGALHLGNAFAFLTAWLSARSQNLRLVLRIEDIDPERSRPEYAAAIMDDLRWLGLGWDEGPDLGGPYAPYEQSRRLERYAAALKLLETEGLTYPCYCTRKELRSLASAPHPGDEGAPYPGLCRHLDVAARRSLEEAGRRASVRLNVQAAQKWLQETAPRSGQKMPQSPHALRPGPALRFAASEADSEQALIKSKTLGALPRTPPGEQEAVSPSPLDPRFLKNLHHKTISNNEGQGASCPLQGSLRGQSHLKRINSCLLNIALPVKFNDAVLGPQSISLERCGGDFALRRPDGVVAYQLAVALDDAQMGVSEVVRGEDLLLSSPRQILLLRLLGRAEPRYAHLPLVHDAFGQRLAKRHKALTLAALREAGVRPEAVCGWLAHLAGWTEALQAAHPAALTAAFNFARLRGRRLTVPENIVDILSRL